MTKRIIFLIVILFINATLFAQWYQFFPMSSDYSFFNDTAINTSAILKVQGIKKIMVYKNAPSEEKNSFLYTTRYLNAYGNSDKIIECFQNKKKDTSFCTTYIFNYNKNETIDNFYLKQANGQIVQSDSTVYINKNETKTYSRYKLTDTLESFDTIVYRKNYNSKNQITKSVGISNDDNFLNSEIYYYSNEGFLDSMWSKILFNKKQFHTGSVIFKRNKKKNINVLRMESFAESYEWVYNKQDQCTNLKVFAFNPNYSLKNDDSKFVIKTLVEYKYNEDGTLKEIIEENNDRPTLKLYYYYFK